MTICCFPNCAYLSETSRMILVYKELLESGEKVLMATHGGTYEFFLKEEGIPYHIVQPSVSHDRSLDYAAASRGERGFYGGGIYNSDNELREHVKNEIIFLKEQSIRIVLIGWTLSCAISARVLGITLAETHLASLVPPAIGKIGIPPIEPFDRYLCRLIPESLIGIIYHRAMRLNILIKPFNTVAREYGIKPFTGFLDLMMADLTFVTDTPEILGITREKMERWKPFNPRLYSRKYRLHYVGAMYAKLFGDIPEDVKKFLDTSGPKLYIALTSSRMEYVLSLYQTVKKMNLRAIIVTTVHDSELSDTADIMIKKHLPSHLVMPLVDCAIIHGGQGSTQTAIASGTPVIGFPFHGEQSMNLKLIERAGAGFCLPLRYLKKNKVLGRYIKRIISNPSFRQNMTRLKSYQEQYNGPENAAKILKGLQG